MTDFSGKRPAETRVSRSDSEHLLGTHPSSQVGSAAMPFPLLDFLGAIRKFTGCFTHIQWLNPNGFGSKREQGFSEIAEKAGFSEIFFFLRLHSGKRKHSHPQPTTRLSFPYLGLHSRTKQKYSTQYNYSILQLEYFFLPNFTNDSGLHDYRLDLLELLVDACFSQIGPRP